MGAEDRIVIREANAFDIVALTAIKGAGSEVLHRDRLRDARDPGFRYYVLEDGGEVLAYACLVFRRPLYWSDAADLEHLPQIVDLQVAEAKQGQGYGTCFIQNLEYRAAQSGFERIYLSVEPFDNPRALALYMRLGYMQLQPAPYQERWEYIDSDGKSHRGVAWVVDMVKKLRE